MHDERSVHPAQSRYVLIYDKRGKFVLGGLGPVVCFEDGERDGEWRRARPIGTYGVALLRAG